MACCDHPFPPEVEQYFSRMVDLSYQAVTCLLQASSIVLEKLQRPQTHAGPNPHFTAHSKSKNEKA